MGVNYKIITVNKSPNCVNNETIIYQLITGCSESFILRITPTSDAIGPFDIYTGATTETPIYVNVSRDEMVFGKVLTLSDPADCPTTPTPTPTNTPTPVSPTPTVTPT